MRKKRRIQMPLLIPHIDHPHAEELRRISDILDSIPTISDMVWQDLTRGAKNATGACGMTAEQVLRAKIIKTLCGFTYEELAFHLVDSRCYRHFCRIGVAHEGFAKSTLHGAIKALSAETLEAINRLLMAYGEDKEVEKGREVRIDCTVVDSLFESLTDILVKDRRATYYGHKVCLTVGRSNLVTDGLITKGNPADTSPSGDHNNGGSCSGSCNGILSPRHNTGPANAGGLPPWNWG